jgi:hypothetical protein
MSTGKSIAVQADIFWACTQHPNPSSDKEQYTVNLSNLSDKAAKALEEMGITVRSDALKRPDEGQFITCKSNYKIDAFDAEGNPIPANIKIGNGSKATAIVSFYEWSYRGKKGVSPSLKKLTITNLIEYNASNLDELEEEVL